MQAINNVINFDNGLAMDLFDSVEMLQPLTKSQRCRLFSFGAVRPVQEGETLIEEGAKDGSFYILLSGACSIRRTVSDRGLGQFKEVEISHRKSPSVLNEMAFIDQEPSLDIIFITSPGLVWALTPTALQYLAKEAPKLNFFLMRIASKLVSEHLRNYQNALTERYADLDLNNVAYLNRNENPTFFHGIRRALVEQIMGEYLNHYPDAYSENVIKKLSEWLKLPKEWLMVVAGSSIGLDMIARTYAHPGVRIIISAPTFEVFGFSTRKQQADVTEYAYQDPYTPDVDEFLANTDAAADIIYIANPSTPTGACHTLDQLKQLIEARPNALFIIDEAYLEFTKEFQSQGAMALLHENQKQVVIVRTLSKAFGLAGLRIGYIIGHPERIAQIHNFLIPYSVNRLSQVAACTILDHHHEVVAQVQHICEQRELMTAGLRNLGYRVEVGQTNFLLLFVPDAMKAIKFFRRHDIVLRYVSSPCKPHYLGECVRISMGSAEDTERIIAVAKLMLAEKHD
jgi:histidinol-phosphate aminotransferase